MAGLSKLVPLAIQFATAAVPGTMPRSYRKRVISGGTFQRCVIGDTWGSGRILRTAMNILIANDCSACVCPADLTSKRTRWVVLRT